MAAACQLMLSLVVLSLFCALFCAVDGEDTIASLAAEVRELKDTLAARDAADQQESAELSRLAESLQVLTAAVGKDGTKVKGRQTEERQETQCDNDFSTQLRLLQSSLEDNFVGFRETANSKLRNLETLLHKFSELQNSRGVSRLERRLKGSFIQVDKSIDVIRSKVEVVTNFALCTRNKLDPHPGTCTQRLTGIKPAVSQTRLDKARQLRYWGTDVVRKDGIIYIIEDRGRNLSEYQNLQHVWENQIKASHDLGNKECMYPIIRDRHVVCSTSDGEGSVYLFSLDTDRVVKERAFEPLYSHCKGLFADDSWIWVWTAWNYEDMPWIPQETCTLHLERLDPTTLETVTLWHTEVEDTGPHFLICGVFYFMNANHTSVKQLYDSLTIETRVLEEGGLIMMPEETEFSCFQRVHYDPQEKILYHTTCDNLTKYPVELKDRCQQG